MLFTNRFRATINNSWKSIRDIKGKYPSRSLSCPRAWLCIHLAQLYDLFPKHSSSQHRMKSILKQVPCPEAGGREEWVGDTLTDADKHASPKLCGQSVWFLSLPLPTEVGRNCFLWYYSKDGNFKKQIHLINVPCFILTWSTFEIIESNCYWHLFIDVTQQKVRRILKTIERKLFKWLISN